MRQELLVLIDCIDYVVFVFPSTRSAATTKGHPGRTLSALAAALRETRAELLAPWLAPERRQQNASLLLQGGVI